MSYRPFALPIPGRAMLGRGALAVCVAIAATWAPPAEAAPTSDNCSSPSTDLSVLGTPPASCSVTVQCNSAAGCMLSADGIFDHLDVTAGLPGFAAGEVTGGGTATCGPEIGPCSAGFTTAGGSYSNGETQTVTCSFTGLGLSPRTTCFAFMQAVAPSSGNCDSTGGGFSTNDLSVLGTPPESCRVTVQCNSAAGCRLSARGIFDYVDVTGGLPGFAAGEVTGGGTASCGPEIGPCSAEFTTADGSYSNGETQTVTCSFTGLGQGPRATCFASMQ